MHASPGPRRLLSCTCGGGSCTTADRRQVLYGADSRNASARRTIKSESRRARQSRRSGRWPCLRRCVTNGLRRYLTVGLRSCVMIGVAVDGADTVAYYRKEYLKPLMRAHFPTLAIIQYAVNGSRADPAHQPCGLHLDASG